MKNGTETLSSSSNKNKQRRELKKRPTTKGASIPEIAPPKKERGRKEEKFAGKAADNTRGNVMEERKAIKNLTPPKSDLPLYDFSHKPTGSSLYPVYF